MEIWVLSLGLGMAVLCIGLLARVGILESLNQRPAMVLSVAVVGGMAWGWMSLPVANAQFTSHLADLGLAALVFSAGLQFRLTRIRKISPVAFTLAFFASPLFLAMTAPSAFVLIQGLTLTSAIILAAALMLNGSVLERRAVTNSASPATIKKAISLESAAALALGVPLALIIEATAKMPQYLDQLWMSAPIWEAPFGLAVGGALGLVLGRLRHRKMVRENPDQAILELAIAAGLLFILLPFIHGSAIIGVGALSLFWTEEAQFGEAFKRGIRRRVEMLVVPVAYVVFGFALGPRLLDADALVIVFIIAAVTILRVFPRMVLLQRHDIPKDHKAFIAWFGGAPGVATALFLLHLMGSTAIVDQEPVLVIGISAVFVSVLATRISAKPLANHFARQARISMKRRWYQKREA